MISKKTQLMIGAVALATVGTAAPASAQLLGCDGGPSVDLTDEIRVEGDATVTVAGVAGVPFGVLEVTASGVAATSLSLLTDVIPPDSVSLGVRLIPFSANVSLAHPSELVDNPGTVRTCERPDGRVLITWRDVVSAEGVAAGDVSLTNSFQLVIDTQLDQLACGTTFQYRYGLIEWVADTLDGTCPEPVDLDACEPASASWETNAGFSVLTGSQTNAVGTELTTGSNVGVAGVWGWGFRLDEALPQCGDGETDDCPREDCDDAGESETCDVDCTYALCGDGLVNTTAGEACDPGSGGPYRGCSESCTVEVCGDLTAVLGTQVGDLCTATDDDGAPFCGVENSPDSVEHSYVFTAPGLGEYTFSTLTDRWESESEFDIDPIVYVRESCFPEDSESYLACADNTDVGGEVPLPFATTGSIILERGESVIVYVTQQYAWQPCGSFELTVAGEYCGDGIQQTSLEEGCDDGNTIDGDGCTADCEVEFCGDAVINNDGAEVCDDGTDTETCDSDCTAPECGDGYQNYAAGEECDDEGESASCNADCTYAYCGDGVVNTTAGEECDDGNFEQHDGCGYSCLPDQCGSEEAFIGLQEGNSCERDSDPQPCGIMFPGQTEMEPEFSYVFNAPGPGVFTFDTWPSDDFSGQNFDTVLYLRSECGAETEIACNDNSGEEAIGFSTIEDVPMNAGDSLIVYVGGADGMCGDFELEISGQWCGDGNLDTELGEACDDGNTDDDDGCSAACQVEVCGDGIVNGDEDCDAEAEYSDTCDADCTAAECGDGDVNEIAGETCDDEGESATCNADCTAAACGDSVVNATAGESCDDGNTVDGDGCSATCEEEVLCGNGNLDDGEGCDDGNTDDGDGCSATCQPEPVCGNETVEDGESCDDGNTVDGDGCSSTCQEEAACGDGNLDADESCDDGNTVDGDGCSATCDVEAACGDGNVDAGESCDDGNTTSGDGCSSTCAVEDPAAFEFAGGACNNTVAGNGRTSAAWLSVFAALLVLRRRRDA